MSTKLCTTCKQMKPLKKFTKDSRNTDGYTCMCKNCESMRQKNMREQNWKKILQHYGKKCACCGEMEQAFLTVDHVHNDGAKHRKIINRGRLYAYLARGNFSSGYQILCWNCNCAKSRSSICPHKTNK